ncbi:hypothetical protein ACSQ67_023492 [Phaseolus vulgaris]
MLVRRRRRLVRVALWCVGVAAFERRRDCVGGARRCAMVVVRRRLRGVATAWVAREGVRQWWCYDCLSDACRCAMVVVRDVASVVVQDSIVKLEKAYDKLMMAQLTNWKKGVTFGSFKELIITTSSTFMLHHATEYITKSNIRSSGGE